MAQAKQWVDIAKMWVAIAKGWVAIASPGAGNVLCKSYGSGTWPPHPVPRPPPMPLKRVEGRRVGVPPKVGWGGVNTN